MFRFLLTSPAPQTDTRFWRMTIIYLRRVGSVRDEGCHSCRQSCCCKFCECFRKYRIVSHFYTVNYFSLKQQMRKPFFTLQSGNRGCLSRWGNSLLHLHTLSDPEPECCGTSDPLSPRKSWHPATGQSLTPGL